MNNENSSSFIVHYSQFVVGQAYKPDSVDVSPDADGHFSAAAIARDVTKQVSPPRSNQPENSAGRVFPKKPSELRFLLGLAPRKGCRIFASPQNGSAAYPTISTLPAARRRQEECFLLPCLAAGVAACVVAVSDCTALWCPDFPHNETTPAARPSGLSKGNYTSPILRRFQLKSRVCFA